MPFIPYYYWFTQISEEKEVTDRCPFATVESCPRFYHSLSLLGDAGKIKLPNDESDRLLAYWKTSDLWSKTKEDVTLISGPTRESYIFSNFCPEVNFDCFGYFTSNFSRHAVEIDVKASPGGFPKKCAVKTNWRWRWATLQGQHYRECPVYSILFRRQTGCSQSSLQRKLPWWKKFFAEIISVFIVIAIGSLLLLLKFIR